MPSVKFPVSPDRFAVATKARGLVAETFPWTCAAAGSVATTGSWWGTLCGLRAGDVVTNVVTFVTVVGSTLSLVKLGVWDSAGTLLAASADVHTSFTSGTQFKVIALSAPYTVPSDDGYYLGIVSVGTTGPSLGRANSLASPNAGAKIGSSPRSHATAATQTDAATVTPADAGIAFWFGVS